MSDQEAPGVAADSPRTQPLDRTDDLSDFAAEVTDQIESFLIALREIARSGRPNGSVPMLLLEVSQLLLAGGRLGAIRDIVPDERFEPDPGYDADVEDLRAALDRKSVV